MPTGHAPAALRTTTALAGAAVLGAELAGARLLAPYIGNDITVWSALLSVVMAALALGYTLGGVIADRYPRRTPGVLVLAGAGIWMGGVALWGGSVAAAFGQAIDHPGLASAAITALLLGPPALVLAMISPLVLRLAAPDADHTGRIAGQLFAAGTIGSILGSLGVGFWALPVLGTRVTMLALALLCIVGASVLCARHYQGQMALAVLALMVTSITLGSSERTMPGQLLATNSAYARVEVTERAGVRTLALDGQPQSAWRPAQPLRDVFDYSRALWLGPAAVEHAAASRAGRVRILVIGLGGGTFPRALTRMQPGMRVSAYEIDPVVVDAARRWFALPDTVRVEVGDGRRLLGRSQERFDVIVLDAYRPTGVPFHLVTAEATALVRARLRPGGVMVANVWGSLTGERSRLWRAVAATMRSVFPAVAAYPVRTPGPDADGPRNMIIVGAERLPAPATLIARADALSARATPRMSAIIGAPVPAGDGVILRDDRAQTTQALDPAGRPG